MFLFSMPTEEALYLAGFDRYASSMVIMALGLAGMFLARQIDYAFYEQRIDYRNFKSYKSIKTKKLYQYMNLNPKTEHSKKECCKFSGYFYAKFSVYSI